MYNVCTRKNERKNQLMKTANVLNMISFGFLMVLYLVKQVVVNFYLIMYVNCKINHDNDHTEQGYLDLKTV